MSSGPSDAAAEGRMVEEVERAAAAFAEAVKSALEGHRGYAVPAWWIRDRTNEIFEDAKVPFIRLIMEMKRGAR